jgi:hypothetical protein
MSMLPRIRHCFASEISSDWLVPSVTWLFNARYSFTNCRIKLTWSKKNKLLNYATRYADINPPHHTTVSGTQIQSNTNHFCLSDTLAAGVQDLRILRLLALESSFNRLLDQLKYRLTHCIRAGRCYCGETGEWRDCGSCWLKIITAFVLILADVLVEHECFSAEVT